MKIIKIKLVMVLLTCTFSLSTLWAQSPEKMSYQAVIRNSSNQLVVNTQIGMKISVLKGSATGTPVYVETKTPTTNANGLVSIEIGGGVGFDTINWSNDTYFIKTETAVVAPLTTYTITGVSQLLSVPYALHAKTAEGITGGIVETDPVFAAHPANGITATDVTNWNNKLSLEIDGSVTNEIQFLSISNDTVYLTNGGFVKLPAGFNGQYGSLTGAPTLSTVATSGSYSDLSGTPTIPTTTSQLTNNSGFLTSEVDGSITNEIQALSISNDTIYLSNGGFVKLPSANGSETKVNAGINVTVTGVGTTASPYVIGETPGTVEGQMKYWNGTSWVTVARGSSGQVLTSVNGIPTWGGIQSVGTNEVQNPITGAIWMDRNLGATQVATNSTDAAAYGYLYQWGRGTDGHQIRTSGITPTLSNSDTVGHGNFITSSDWRSPKNDNLWQGVSGTNNPCPSGYRLPTDAEWDTERLSWSSDNSAGAFASPLKLPMAGIRYNTNGLLSDAGANGHYWSSTVSGIYARRLSFTNIHSDMGIGNRAWGFSVRCIKD